MPAAVFGTELSPIVTQPSLLTKSLCSPFVPNIILFGEVNFNEAFNKARNYILSGQTFKHLEKIQNG